MTEEWRPVVGYRGYEVSDHGGVKSYRGLEPRILKPYRNRGYWKVNLGRGDGTVRHGVGVHTLVASAFIGDTTGKHVHHIDGDRGNNFVGNLEVLSPEEHADAHNRLTSEGTARTGLTWEDVRGIRKLQHSWTTADLSDRYGVSYTTIRRIILDLTWKSRYDPSGEDYEPPTSRKKVSYSGVDWSMSDDELADLLGASPKDVSQARLRLARYTRVSKKRRLAWDAVDWSLTNSEIADLMGVQTQAVWKQRKKRKK